MKFKEIKEAFDLALSGSVRLVILNGPSGCGKSTALRLLCRQSGLRLIEFSNPVRLSSLFVDPNADNSNGASRSEVGTSSNPNVESRTPSNLSSLPQDSVLAPVLSFIRGLRYDSISLEASSLNPSEPPLSIEKAVYMIDDIPYLYSTQQRVQLQSALTQHIQSPHASPLFIVVSDSNTGIILLI